jgi:predicted RNA methylase
MNALTQLKELYAKNSKHSNYQVLSDKLGAIIGADQIEVKSRYESERLDYILKNIDVANKSILDIGGNSGYFTFESIEAGARMAHHYEGNAEHSDFVKIAAEAIGYGDKVEVTNRYYTFESEGIKHYDITFLLNVLHHLGDDYGYSKLSITAAKEKILEQIRSMAATTETLVFQLGFNWKGD